jgi:catechol 2,3-dioxygenase-like lactoylglutathione lyase family enzyme
MIDHVGLSVSNFGKSKKFYDSILPSLGYRAGFTDEKAGVAGFFGKDGTSLWVSKGKPKEKVHLAIRVSNRATVKKFYETALKAGGRDNGEPGPRPQYTPTYYAAFVLDPDGHNVEAVCHAKK